jgi:hypothetical protein
MNAQELLQISDYCRQTGLADPPSPARRQRRKRQRPPRRQSPPKA